MSTTFYTSDWHCGHTNIIDYCNRPFADLDEMHHALITRYRARVTRDDDIVWFLGDNAINGAWRTGLEIMAQLPGRKRLILGNHDRGWPGHKSWLRYLPDYQRVFEVVLPWARTSLAGVDVLLSHFPYAGHGDSQPVERYSEYRLPVSEKPLLHGHTHSTERVPVLVPGGGPQIHVGVDAWDFTPVSANDLVRLIFR